MRVSWSHLRQRWPLLVLIVLLDILFLYFFGKIYAEIFLSLTPHLDAINQLLQQSIGTFTTTQDPASLQIGVEQFGAEVRAVKLAIAQTLGSLFVLWTLFQGLIWYLARRIAGTAPGFLAFAWRALLASVAACALFVGILAGGIWLSVRSSSSPLPLIGQSGINILTAVAVLVLLYLLFVAYAVIGQGRFWWRFVTAAFTRITTSGLAFVVLLGVLAVLYTVMLWIGKQNVIAALAFGAFILLPAYAALRVFFVESIRA